MAAVHDRPFDVAAEVERLREEAKRVLPGPGAQAVIAAAEARGVPVRRLDDEGLLMLGHGARQRRVSPGEAADGEALVALDLPEGDDGRIPIVGVTGVNGKTTVTRLIARILRGTGRTVGMTCTDGIYINDRRHRDRRLQRAQERPRASC